jgi:hypothetical protein
MEWEMEVPQEKDGMTQKFALKSSLRKGMLRTLRGMPDDLVEQQCERPHSSTVDSLRTTASIHTNAADDRQPRL